MVDSQPFVGRLPELAKFREALESPLGQAVVVVGQQGMGKTLLVNRMADTALDHPDLQCDSVRFEVTENDDPAAVMELMIDRAFDAGGGERSWDKTERSRNQRLALIKLIPVVGKDIAELTASLQRDPKRNSREQLIERLRLISGSMKENARAIFVIDPEKYMSPKSASEWRVVVKALPDKIKFIFAQRHDDVLAQSHEFLGLSSVIRIPSEDLDRFDEQTLEDLIQTRADKITVPITDVRNALRRYDGHPYAIAAALDLLADGARLSALPADPTKDKVAAAQWNRVCKEHGQDAISLLEAFAVLEVSVPDEVVEATANISPKQRKMLESTPYIQGLLRSESDGKRIYHSLLADYVRSQLSNGEAKKYHRRAIETYRARLNRDPKPDGLAAQRLPEHVLAVEGSSAFVECFIRECTSPLLDLGHFGAMISLTERALSQVDPRREEKPVLLCNLGVAHERQGRLDEAERTCESVLAIGQAWPEIVASTLGNLGDIYFDRDEFDRAEEFYSKALRLNEKLGRPKAMIANYAGLANVATKRGKFEPAEQIQRTAIELAKATKLDREFYQILGNLGAMYFLSGRFDDAEKSYLQSLAGSEAKGLLATAGKQYFNLGELRDQFGDTAAAREFGIKARNTFTKAQMPHMAKQMQEWIDGFDKGA